MGLVYGQVGLACLVGNLKVERRGNVVLLGSPYPHLTGGVAGLLTEVVVVPKAWQDVLAPQTFAMLIKRKQALIARCAHLFGLTAALLWNTLGFVVAYFAAGGIHSVAELVSFSLWSTLWAFLGVLLLPTPSRLAVFQGDALALAGGGDSERLADAIRRLDRDQDDEFRRGQAVEAVFHPIPSAAKRLEKLGDAAPRFATWHLARTALYLSWANLSWLARAVHCNLGRPEVWVFLPSD